MLRVDLCMRRSQLFLSNTNRKPRLDGPCSIQVTSRKGSFFGLRKSLIHRARCGSAPACGSNKEDRIHYIDQACNVARLIEFLL